MTNTSREGGTLLPGLDGGAGPAMPIADTKARAIIAAAMAGGAPPPAGDGPSGGGSASSTGTTSAVVKIGAAAAVLSAIAVTALVATRGGDAPPSAPPPPVVVATPELTQPAPPPAIAPAVTPPAQTNIERPPTPAVTKKRPPRRPARATIETPEDLLRLANKARKARDWRGANALYVRVMKSHRGSRSGYVATVASAQLSLGTLGAPAKALRLFRAALAQEPRGFLTEEARFGVAESYRKLGNAKAEAAALERFLRHHGSSPLTQRARARLGALKGDAAP